MTEANLNNGASRAYRRAGLADFVASRDRRLVLPWFGNLGLSLTGRRLYEVYQSPDVQLEVALALDAAFEADFVGIMDDGIVLSETLGAGLLLSDYDFPSVALPPVRTAADLARLNPPDPERDGRIPLNLKAIRRLTEQSPKPLAISIEGPFTLAGQLMGVPDLARSVIGRPALVEALLDFTTESVSRYARAVARAGADLVSLAEPTAIILSPGQFERLVRPRLARLFSALECWKALHICGETSHLLEQMTGVGVDALSLDQLMDIPALTRTVPPGLVLFGNIDPIGVMLNGSPHDVRRETMALLAATRDYPYFIMSTGCDLSRETPLDNMRAFMEAGRAGLETLPPRAARRTEKSAPRAMAPDHLPEAEPSPGRDRPNDMLAGIRDAVREFDTAACVRLCREALEAGLDARAAVQRGLAAGMTEAGRLFERQVYFVPELIMASDALHAGLDILRPALAVGPMDVQGRIVLGVVEGDIHEIGKNLVRTMFTASNWEVVDLGTSVGLEEFDRACREHRPDIVGLSALMSTTVRLMPKFIAELRKKHPGVRFMVGGAPLSPQLARHFGADGYARDAIQAVSVAAGLVKA